MKASRFIIFRKHRESAEKAGKPMTFLRIAGLTLLALFLLAAVGIGINYALFSRSFPSLGRFEAHYTAKPEPTRFYARDGETLLFSLAYENFESRDLAICEEDGEGCIPRTFTEAARISREAGSGRENSFATAEEMVRKVYAEDIAASRYPNLLTEILTRQVLRYFGADQLLSWYYNNAWFGQMAFGLDAAARLYLDRSGDSLSDAECVLMSAIINTPMLNPIDSKGALRDSYLQQLSLLHQAGLFTDEEAETLSRNNFIIFEPPRYVNGSEPDIITRKALDTVLNRYGREQVERGGLKVITTEDVPLQTYLRCITSELTDEEKALVCPLTDGYDEDELQKARETVRLTPVSAAVLDIDSGELLAVLEAQINRENRRTYANAAEAYPIGSTMNWFAALTAFSGGDSPSTLIWDLESSYGADMSSDDQPYQGPVTLRQALTTDFLRPLTARLGAFGSGTIQRNAELFGLTNSHSISEKDILYEGSTDTAETLAFSLIPFARLGDQTGTNASGSMRPVTIISIETDSEEPEKTPQPVTSKSLIAENLAYLVHHVFSQNTENVRLSDRPAAVKSGSVRGEESIWISGYTTRISCALRVGAPRTTSPFIEEADPVRETAEILWRSVMEYAHRNVPASGWEIPEDVSQVRVCLPSGKLPTAACQETMTEIFLRGNEPYEYDEFYVSAVINRQNRMLATRFTPAEDIETAVFMNLPSEAAEWAAANGVESMPSEYDPIRDENRQNGTVRIESPSEFQIFIQGSGEQIEVVVRLLLNQRPESLQVSVGSGLYPTQWTEVCTGETADNGKWMLCSIDPDTLEPGLYALRTAFTLPNRGYRSAETYFEIR